MRVRTSEHVKDAEFTVQVDGKLVDAKISKQYGDLRSFDLTLGAELSNGQNVEVQVMRLLVRRHWITTRMD